MAVYKIVEEGDPVLRRKCKPVPEITPNILKLLTNMADTMYANRGVGLAAPQVGISKRVIVVDIGEQLYEMINPVILESKGEQCDQEGCLSFPDVIGEVTRAEEVLVTGLNKEGQTVQIRAKGYLARAFQHEIDHLDGRLFIDKAKNIRRS
ncbi:MAG: peptide deformylase [Clostridia bacterium]|nr:peptide deformylase [Clostridia bacterium]